MALTAGASAQTGTPVWSTYGRSFLHRATAPAPTQTLNRVLWSTPVDRQPQYVFGSFLLIHYGSPVITHNNVICIPVKTGVSDGFIVEGRNGTTGALVFQMGTDYSLPESDWTPSFGPALSPDGRLYVPAAGGTLLRRDNPEVASSPSIRVAFFGYNAYFADKGTFNSNVKITTPLTTDAAGNVYFGYRTYGGDPDKAPVGAMKLLSGIAKIGVNGVNTWKTCAQITGDPTATHVQFQCAPAVSPDGQIVYVGVKKSAGGGYLVGLNTSDLSLKYRRRLYDPSTGNDAGMTDSSSGTPMIGPDGDVYFGVLSNPHTRHNGRGFLLHFDRTLVTQKAPGSFGWDITPSFVPTSIVPGYTGGSSYLLLVKYNNYAGFGTGDGVNRVALLDPNTLQKDAINGINVMKEVRTVIGPTPDPNHQGPDFPNAVWEWCVNSTVIDTTNKSALINSEDGFLYRWSFVTNTITEGVLLDGPRGQAYTPTLSGPTGIVYAINNARLFAIGN